MEWRISFACYCMMPGPGRIAQSRTLQILVRQDRQTRRVMIQPMSLRRKLMRRAFLSTIISVCAVLLTVQAQQPQTVMQGVYAENQARRGQTIYKAQCALCHGEMLEGRLGPPLTGDEFVSDFAKQPLSELFGKIRNTIPPRREQHRKEQLSPVDSIGPSGAVTSIRDGISWIMLLLL